MAASHQQGFKLTGMKELNAALKMLGPEVATKVGASASRKATNKLRDAVKQAAPRGKQPTKKTWKRADGSTGEADYGRLHQNIKTRKVRARQLHTVSFVVTTGDAFWGRFLEFGTRHQPATPFFKPAIDQAAPDAVAILQTELERAIKRAARRANK